MNEARADAQHRKPSRFAPAANSIEMLTVQVTNARKLGANTSGSNRINPCPSVYMDGIRADQNAFHPSAIHPL